MALVGIGAIGRHRSWDDDARRKMPSDEEVFAVEPRRVLVVGATGYIGRSPVSEIVAQGHSVR